MLTFEDAAGEVLHRIYRRQECVVFRKTREAFGGLSNMASGFPLKVNGVRIPTSEALYQACRFPHMPDVQNVVITQASPMTAKMKSKPFRSRSRPDWDEVRVAIMKWCLKVKLVQNWEKFGSLLLSTRDQAIVEESRKDVFWGARPSENDVLEGGNVLGRLLMELRERLKTNPLQFDVVSPVPIPDFRLLGQEIGNVCGLNRTYLEGFHPFHQDEEEPPEQQHVLQFRREG